MTTIPAGQKSRQAPGTRVQMLMDPGCQQSESTMDGCSVQWREWRMRSVFRCSGEGGTLKAAQNWCRTQATKIVWRFMIFALVRRNRSRLSGARPTPKLSWTSKKLRKRQPALFWTSCPASPSRAKVRLESSRRQPPCAARCLPTVAAAKTTPSCTPTPSCSMCVSGRMEQREPLKPRE